MSPSYRPDEPGQPRKSTRPKHSRNGNGEALPPYGDEESARLLVATARSRQPLDEATADRLTADWKNGCYFVEDTGLEGVDQWLRVLRSSLRKEPVRFDAIKAAIDRALAGEPETSAEPVDPDAPFDFGLIDTATFFGKTYRLDFLAKGILVKEQPCVFGGPQKSLKTSILLDLAISLASGTPFLGRFEVLEPAPVGIISGESGTAVIQANAKQICNARDLPFDRIAGIHWGFDPPRLSVPRHLAGLRKVIGDKGLKAILLDPLYLMLISESSAIDPKDMFQMGPLLADAAAACLDAGATPVLCHHFVKKRDDPFGPPDMGELAYAGIGQFMRQWMLISRRERYNAETGLHAMHFNYGGSAGHSGELHLDIETGRITEELEGREWRVTAFTPGEGRLAREHQAKLEKAMKEAEKQRQIEERTQARIRGHAEQLFGVMIIGKPESLKVIREKAGLNNENASLAMRLLIRDGRVRQIEIRVKNAKSERTTYGYEIIPPDGYQGELDLNGD